MLWVDFLSAIGLRLGVRSTWEVSLFELHTRVWCQASWSFDDVGIPSFEADARFRDGWRDLEDFGSKKWIGLWIGSFWFPSRSGCPTDALKGWIFLGAVHRCTCVCV